MSDKYLESITLPSTSGESSPGQKYIIKDPNVPIPSSADANKFLKGNGTWSTVSLENTTYTLGITTGNNSTLNLISGNSTIKSITIPNTTNTTYAVATTNSVGLMSVADKVALNNLTSATNTYKNVQANWTESNTNSDAYIKNKPTIPTVPGTFTSSANGLVPKSGTAASNTYLNATGGWTIPAGTGTADTDTTYSLSISTAANSTLKLVDSNNTTSSIVIPNTTNTTYGSMSTAEGATGTATSNRVLTAKNLKDIVNNLTSSLNTSVTNLVNATSSYQNVQADWNTTATNSDSYIKNKPTIPTIPGVVTTSVNGLMSSTDKSKLNSYPSLNNSSTQFLSGDGTWRTVSSGSGIDNDSTYSLTQNSTDKHKLIWEANGANPTTFTIPDNNTTYGIVTTSANGLMSAADKKKLDTMSTVDNNTTYDLSISTASNSTIHLISGNSTVRNITIPNTTNTTYAAVTTSVNGLMSAADKTKLNGYPTINNNGQQFLSGDGTWKTVSSGSGIDNDSTYSLTQDSTDKHKLIWKGSNVTQTTFTIPDNNTTYDLSTIAGTLSVSKGGTGATNAAGARTNLQAASTVVVTTAANGLMSAADKIKLNALSTVSQSGTLSGTTGTDNYKVVLSKTASTATIPAASTSAAGVMTTAQVSKLNGVAAGANNYTHPSYTAATGAPTANQSPGFGGTFSVNQVNRDATGHIGSLTNRTITIPSAVVTTAENGLMNAAVYKLITENALGASDSNFGGQSTSTGYRLNLQLANIWDDNLLVDKSVVIPQASSASYGVVKPDGTATHFLNGTGGWTAPSGGGTSYNTMSSAQMITGTATTNRVINAANLTNYIKNSVVPIGSIKYTTTSAAPTDFGTWTNLWSMESFKTQLRQNESFWPAYCGGTSESVVFAVTIPHLSQAMSFNPQESLPWIGNDFGSGGAGNSFRYFNNQDTFAVLNDESAGSSEVSLHTRSVIGDTIRVDFRGYHNLWRAGTSGSSTYARPEGNSVGMLRCSFLYVYDLPPCWCWIRTS